MAFLNSRQKLTLMRVCNALVPALEANPGENSQLFGIRASDLNVDGLLEAKLEQVITVHQQKQLIRFLNLLEIPLVNLFLARRRGHFSTMDIPSRTAVLQAWANSRIPLRRQAFHNLKRLTLFLFYATTPDGKPNPTWPIFHFLPPPPPPPRRPNPIQPLHLERPSLLKADILIIGSGAGGSVIAAELSAAGHEVLVVEKGGYYTEADFHGRELDGYATLYENQAALTTHDLSINILAGTGLGGGTIVNWNTSLHSSDAVLHEWATTYGFSAATSSAYSTSVAAVVQRLHINSAESSPNRQNQLLAEGAAALGYQVDVIPRNVRNCVDCTYCNFGCAYGAKQSTTNTYLQDAFDHGARLLVHTHVDRVLHQNGRVTGAECRLQQNGRTHTITIHAPIVIVAAGAIHTPALLLRSGLTNKQIGQNLHLHPVVQTWGIYEEPVYSWQGAPQTRVIQDFANMDGDGYGVWLEVAPNYPGVYAAALPWQSGRQHKQLMQQLHLIGDHIVLTRDKYSGQIKLNRQGNPTIHYKLHPYDAQHLFRGMVESFRIHRAANAQRIIAPHNRYITYTPGQDFAAFVEQVRQAEFPSNGYGLFSAHQMSTCRIGGNPTLGAITPEGESYEVQNLFVADASVFPTAVGVNPMLSIMGIAHYIAQHIKTRTP